VGDRLVARSAGAMVRSAVKDGHIITLTYGAFASIDVVRAMFREIGPCHIRVSTFRINADNARQLARWLESGKILSVEVLTSAKSLDFAKVRAAERAQLDATVDALGDALRFGDLHTKWVIGWNDEGAVTGITSANMNKNRRLEMWDMSSVAEVLDRMRAIHVEAAKFTKTREAPRHPGDKKSKRGTNYILGLVERDG